MQISMAFNKYHSMFVCWKHGKVVKLTLVHKNAIMHVCLKIEESFYLWTTLNFELLLALVSQL